MLKRLFKICIFIKELKLRKLKVYHLKVGDKRFKKRLFS